jgi:hypothetical protein
MSRESDRTPRCGRKAPHRCPPQRSPLSPSSTPRRRMSGSSTMTRDSSGSSGSDLRRAALARLPSPRQPVYPGLWIPGRQAGAATPGGRLAPTQRQAFCHPPVSDPAAVSLRPGQHVPDSIATVRRCLTVALARSLERCPCCALRETTAPAAAVACDAVLLRGWHGTRRPCSGVTHFLRARLRCSLGPVGAARARRP